VRLLARPGGIHACPHAHAVPHPFREPARPHAWGADLDRSGVSKDLDHGRRRPAHDRPVCAARRRAPENDPAWAIITEYFKGQGEAYLEQAEDTAGFAEGDYDIAQASNYDFSPYAEEASYTVTYQNDSVVSFVRSYYSNFGAAYPTVLQLSEQFNRYDGARLHFSDFFSDPEEARARVLKAIHAVTDPLEGYRSADVDRLFHEDNFYLTAEGFVFYYQSEAIARHAAASPNLHSLYRPVRPDGPLTDPGGTYGTVSKK
jgi:sulfur relay (sulfurtransferase) DsrC/TusE family protein